MAFKFNAQGLTAIADMAIADATRARKLAEALVILRPQIEGKDRDEVRDAIVEQYATTCGFETIIVAKGKWAGRVGWPNDCAQKKACNRFIDKLFEGEECVEQSKPKQGQYETPAELLQAALKLVKLANEYEDSKRLAAAAVAQAFASLKA